MISGTCCEEESAALHCVPGRVFDPARVHQACDVPLQALGKLAAHNWNQTGSRPAAHREEGSSDASSRAEVAGKHGDLFEQRGGKKQQYAESSESNVLI